MLWQIHLISVLQYVQSREYDKKENDKHDHMRTHRGLRKPGDLRILLFVLRLSWVYTEYETIIYKKGDKKIKKYLIRIVWLIFR